MCLCALFFQMDFTSKIGLFKKESKASVFSPKKIEFLYKVTRAFICNCQLKMDVCIYRILQL